MDRRHVAVAALDALVCGGALERTVVAEAPRRYEIAPAHPAPWEC